jgi:hypothetical protein
LNFFKGGTDTPSNSGFSHHYIAFRVSAKEKVCEEMPKLTVISNG